MRETQFATFGLALPLAAVLCGAASAPEPSQASRRVVEVDFSKPVGTIRPLHGVNCGPIAEGFTLDLSRFFRDLQIPYVRLHSPNFPGLDCVGFEQVFPDFAADPDNPASYNFQRTDDYIAGLDCVGFEQVFPDFAADPDNPASYNFQRTDDYIAAVLAVGAKPIYGLGYGNRKDVLASDYQKINVPPEDPEKWARVCVNIVRHYNEGWANGFRHNIQNWEVWNEPDAKNFWDGTLEQYADFYSIVATALKKHDSRLKVGGPAISHDLKFLDSFLAVCRQRNLPLDFCSWHCYTERPATVLNRAREVQRLVDHHGFTTAENQLNEWSPCPRPFQDMRRDPFIAREFFERTGSSEGGAFDASVLCFLQDSPVTTATFYAGDTVRWGLIDRNGAPKTSYFAFLAFRQMLDTPRRVIAGGNDLETGFAVLAGLAEDNSQAKILISNHRLDCNAYDIRVSGLPWGDPTTCTRFVVDQHTDLNRYDLAPAITNRFPAGDSLQIATPATPSSVLLLELARVPGSNPTNNSTK